MTIEPPPKHGPLATGDILVVDDTPENLLAVEAALEGLSLNLVKAGSGPEALRHLLHNDVALILLDVQMPGMDGLETARLIRGRRRSRHLPIIFITAFDRDDAQVLEAYKLGAVDFLFKPLQPEVLRAKVSVFVELQRRTAQVARQAEQIRHHERTAGERALAEQRRRLEAEALRHRLAEERQHAEELARLNKELAEADRRKDEFLAMLAHELRNPLASVVSGLALLDDTRLPSPELARAVTAMSRQSAHLVRLVDDLLDVSRVTRGKIELRLAPVRLGDVLDQAVAMATPHLRESNHELARRSDGDDAVLLADEVRLAQVVSNLLSNAARYTPPGGRVEIASSAGPDGVRIAVSDNGRGIEPDLLDRVFEPFVQGEGATRAGLGLGLALVRALTRLHGGKVTAHSDGPERGSRFEVWLPIQDPIEVHAPGELAPGQAAASGSGPLDAVPDHDGSGAGNGNGAPAGLHVVLVEDNDDVRELTGALLRMWGHRTSEAASGQAGIDLITRERPDVALVDLGLPDVEGYQVARAVREALGAACPRLVALSGFGQDQDRSRAFEVGFDEHLAKPASSSDLRRVMVPRTTTSSD